MDKTFKDGWLRFWRTFSHPWPVVFGFAIATIASDILFESLKWIVKAVWARI